MEERLARQIRQQAVFWFGALLLLIGFLWLFSDILLPFVAGMALAYFLDPVADRLQARGTSRLFATVFILAVFLILFVFALMIVVPVLADQIAGFLDRLPALVAGLQALIASTDSDWLKRFGVDPSSLQGNLSSLMSEGAGWLSTLLRGVWDSGKSLINVVSLLVVTPVVAFYLLYDWDHMVEVIDDHLPREHRSTIREIVRDIDAAVAGFVRGQGTVCVLLGIFYAICLTLMGLNFGLLIGLLAGLISFVPFVGAIIGFLLSVSVALVQFWPDWTMPLVAVAIFGVGQFLEGNILQPKLVGGSVGLHPVWLMFALFAFGSLFGFTGMLVAIPAAAAVGVVIRYALGRYKNSELYTGHAPDRKTGSQGGSRKKRS